MTGPYTAYENNPILTARGTDDLFQTVGHGDLFQDTRGNWWGMCLATRTGPSFTTAPMGREAVLFNVTWDRGEWPVLQPVHGSMPAAKLPRENRHVSGSGPWASDNDDYSFARGSMIPKHFIHHRIPREGAFTVTNSGLQVTPSRNNVTGALLADSEIELTGQRGLSFIGRRQAHTLFEFHVDVSFDPQEDGQEAGVTVFRTQLDHIDLGIAPLPEDSEEGASQLVFRLRAEGPTAVPDTKTVPVPKSWQQKPIRLSVGASNVTHYTLAAEPVGRPKKRLVFGEVSAQVVSGGQGTFVGNLLGVFATCNGVGLGIECL